MADEGWTQATTKRRNARPAPQGGMMKEEQTAFSAISQMRAGGFNRQNSDRQQRPGPRPYTGGERPPPFTSNRVAPSPGIGRSMPRTSTIDSLPSTPAGSIPTPSAARLVDYSSLTHLTAAEKVPTGEILEVESSIESMKAIAMLVCRYRTTYTIPEALNRLNTEVGSVRGSKSGGNRGGNDFARGGRILADEPTPEQGARAIAESFARGGKTYSASAVAATPKQGRSRRMQEEDCDPNLVIERIDVDKLLEEPTAPTSAPTADDGETPAEEVAEENFVRRQARRKAGEDDDARVNRKLRGFLNKLTENNYNSILDKSTGDEGISTIEHLSTFISLVFEKAAQMEKFLSVYSMLLIAMRDRMLEKKVIDDQKTYKQLVLNSAQNCFESLVYADWEPSADLDDDEKFNAIVLRKNQRRGLTSFSAKLAQNGILSKKIVHSVVETLLDHGTEKHLEVLICLYNCFLPNEIDLHISKLWKACLVKLNSEIPRVEALIVKEDEPIPTRIRFLLEDLIADWKEKAVPMI